MNQCIPSCRDGQSIPAQFKSEGGQVKIENTGEIPPEMSKFTLLGEENMFQHPDKITCRVDDEDLISALKSIENGKCLEFPIVPRRTAIPIRSLSCTGPDSAFDLGSSNPHFFCGQVQQSNTIHNPPNFPSATTPSSQTSPLSPPPQSSPSSPPPSPSPSPPSPLSSPHSPPPSSTMPSTTLPRDPTTTPMQKDLTPLPDSSTITISSTSIASTPPTPPETSGASATNANKAASLKGEVAGGVLGGIAIIFIIFLLWRRYRRPRNISTSHKEEAMTYRTSQRSSLWSSIPLTSSMLAEASKFDPTRMVKTGLPFDRNNPLAKKPTGGAHPLLPYP